MGPEVPVDFNDISFKNSRVLSLDGESAHGVGLLFVQLFGALQGQLVGGEGSAHRSGLFRAQIYRQPLLALVELAQLLLLRLVHHRQHSRDRLANGADLGQLRCRPTSYLNVKIVIVTVYLAL